MTEHIVMENVVDCRNIPIQTVYRVGTQTGLELRTLYTQTVINNVRGRKEKIWSNDEYRPDWWPAHVPFVSSNHRTLDKYGCYPRTITPQRMADVLNCFTRYVKMQLSAGAIPVNLSDIDADIDLANIELEAVEVAEDSITQELMETGSDTGQGDTDGSTSTRSSPRKRLTQDTDGDSISDSTASPVKSRAKAIPLISKSTPKSSAQNVKKLVTKEESNVLKNAFSSLKKEPPLLLTDHDSPQAAKRKAETSPVDSPTPRKRSSRAAALNHSFIKVRKDGEVIVKQENKDDDDEYMKYSNGATATLTADGDIVVEVAASKPVRKVGRPKKCAESFPKIEEKHPHQEAPATALSTDSTQKMEPQITTPEKAVLSDADSCLDTDSTKMTRVITKVPADFEAPVPADAVLLVCEFCGREGSLAAGWFSAQQLVGTVDEAFKNSFRGYFPKSFTMDSLSVDSYFCNPCSAKLRKLVSVYHELNDVGQQLLRRKKPDISESEVSKAASNGAQQFMHKHREQFSHMNKSGVVRNDEVTSSDMPSKTKEKINIPSDIVFGQLICVTNISEEGTTLESFDAVGFEAGETRVEMMDLWTELWSDYRDVPGTRFVCAICKKSFLMMDALHSHVKTHKTKKPCYECGFCDGAAFESQDKLSKHMFEGRHSEELAKCNICGDTQPAGKMSEHLLTSHTLGQCNCCNNYMLSEQIELHQLLIHGVCRTCKGQCDPLTETEIADQYADTRKPCSCIVKEGLVEEQQICAKMESQSEEELRLELSDPDDDDMYVLLTEDDPDNLESGNVTVIDPDNMDPTLEAAIKAGIVTNNAEVINSDGDMNSESIMEDNEDDNMGDNTTAKDIGEENMDDDNTVKDLKHEIFCVRCERVFDTTNEMVDHMERHHISRAHIVDKEPKLPVGREGFLCNDCGRRFNTKSVLKEHRLCHSDLRPHICEICKRGFKRISALRTHMLGVHSDTVHKCPVCDKGFKSRLYLVRHMKFVHERKPGKKYKCNQCPKEFNSVSGIHYHRKTHKPRQGFQCPLCSRVYMCRSTLNAHMKMHADGNGYPCLVCGSLFLSVFSLKKHQIIHTRAPTVYCEKCNEDIPTRLFGGHMLKHREYIQCKHCPERFQYYPQMVEHERLKHAEVRPFVCSTCSKSFRTDMSLSIHERSHAPSYQCMACPRAFTLERFLERHVEKVHVARQQPHKCRICSKSFIRKHHYTNHLQRHEPWQVALMQHEMQQQQLKEQQLINRLRQEGAEGEIISSTHQDEEGLVILDEGVVTEGMVTEGMVAKGVVTEGVVAEGVVTEDVVDEGVVAEFVTAQTEPDSSGIVEEDTNIELTVGQDWIEHPE